MEIKGRLPNSQSNRISMMVSVTRIALFVLAGKDPFLITLVHS
jgi:hypothetical protein